MITFRKAEGEEEQEIMQSIVYWTPSDCPQRKDPKSVRDYEVNAVRRYLENVTMCRRQWLLDYFDPICAKPGLVPSKCCDICATKTTEMS